jgi:GT2 family glycosyltransferase
MMFGRTTYNHTPSDLKHYCMARNNTVNLRDYRGWPHVLAFWLKTVWFYLFTRPQPGRIALSARGALAGLRGDFTGHRRLLRGPIGAGVTPEPSRSGLEPRLVRETVAIVVVTYNRSAMLETMLAGLARSHRQPDAVIVVDNASTDDTAAVLRAWAEGGSSNEQRQVITSPDNLGGAGGFRAGMKAAYEQGFDRIWLMDDDVIPAPECLDVLMSEDADCLMVVREDSAGRLAEYAATRFDLRNPFAIKPKTASVVTSYPDRGAMPRRVELENVAFEGFMVRRSVIDDIGLPDASFFIFYDDVDFALRARATGRHIWALRDAVVVRQLDFSQQHDLAGWKGFYMYRNLFAVHFRYGANPLVRAKPYAIAAGVSLLKPREARNVTKALIAARGMRAVPRASVD